MKEATKLKPRKTNHLESSLLWFRLNGFMSLDTRLSYCNFSSWAVQLTIHAHFWPTAKARSSTFLPYESQMTGDLNGENSKKGDLWSLFLSPHHWDKSTRSRSCRYPINKTSLSTGPLQGPSHRSTRPVFTPQHPPGLHILESAEPKEFSMRGNSAWCVPPHVWPHT